MNVYNEELRKRQQFKPISFEFKQGDRRAIKGVIKADPTDVEDFGTKTALWDDIPGTWVLPVVVAALPKPKAKASKKKEPAAKPAPKKAPKTVKPKKNG